MSTSQQTDPLIGRLVDGRYRVRARIARGGMATVYVATDLRLERRVALKVMHGHLSDDTVFQSRFIQEARAAARLADPHVVNVFDQGQDGDMAYLVMEYLPGITLRELLREQKRLTIGQTVTIMDAVLSGLAAAHRAGIVHRDVKPENVLLAEDGRIKIGDFGLARATTANTATGAQLMGTIAYLAPELVTRGTADARSDIYSLGIMLYEMLAGEQPYRGEQPMQIAFQHATDSVPRPSVRNPGVPEQLDELVLWSTERSPDDRPVDAREMLDRLREIEKQLGIAPQVTRTTDTGVIRDTSGASGDLTKVLPTTITGPTAAVDDVDNANRLRAATKRRSRRGALLVLLALLLAGGAATAGWWFGSGPGSLVAVPSVAGLDFAAAEDVLAEHSLTAVEGSASSLTVEAGLAISTDPQEGTRLDKDAEVTVVISSGPAETEVQSMKGMTADNATTALLADNHIEVTATTDEYSSKAKGTVLRVSVMPADGSDNIGCTNGCTAHEGDTARLVVSYGPVPDVAGKSFDQAKSDLEAAGLKVSSDVPTEYSDSVAEGIVISMRDRAEKGNWRPGETVTLVVSAGPPLFEIPSVVGLTRDQAKAKLDEAGWTYSYNGFLWDVWPDDLTTVDSQDPAAGEMRTKDTTITFVLKGAG
ncbi:Stk1 family PASTA domain-containing Ser/Thr kinase [Microbacterium fluvii]|uniref:non-specific serine/threonine protein kinase n=1 Tax=Microbacterium fluvii TaxID=415215 RepID=A0ABW2HFX8_9MICO|nr:Stk1 family PASTA domain-containing Ser/Thr kinase [Microbacterium fluvii]MCU4673627.1 Stk1 family PASTA domain-containing Ser/Thr kinase [Microbacterium fluvii]